MLSHKRILRVIFVVWCCLLMTICVRSVADNTQFTSVSVTKILVTPEIYDGEAIKVIGYLYLYPTLGLYLTRDHAEAGDWESLVLISQRAGDSFLAESDCVSKYVQVYGTLKANREGRSEIMDVQKIVSRDPVSVCWSASIKE